jgi:hypothetical protein
MKSFLSKIEGLALAAVLLAGLVSCGGKGNMGQLSLSLTDASTDQYLAVYVTIKEIDVQSASDSGGSWMTVATPDSTFNLLTLVNGVRQQLGLVDLAAGHYTQLRLILGDTPDSGVNILSEAHPFGNYVIDSSDQCHELKVPSGMQTGIKIVQGFDINENSTTELTLDFSASRSVVVAGHSGQYLLKPTIQVLQTALASIMSGSVTQAADNSAVGGALLSAQVYNAAAADIRDQVVVQASTLSDSTGAYKLFIAAGTYNLVASKLAFAPSAAAITAAAGATSTEDFSLAAADAGTVAGTASISGAGSEAFVTLSFRQTVSLNGSDVTIEIASINVAVADGGSYSIDLPVGTYSVVSSTFGMTTQVANVTVTKGVTTPFNVSF